MKRMITQSMKAAALAVGLFGAGAVAQAAAITPGQSVTEFITNDEAGLINVPAFTTADSLANWAFRSYNDGNVISDTDQRGWRGVFEVNVPSEGVYGVAVKMRTTTTNWMIGMGAAQTLATDDRMDSVSTPGWDQLARPTLISTIVSKTDTIEAAVGEPGAEDYVPAITQTTYSFGSGEWETVYVPVKLNAGQNYVTFWLCRPYSGIDALGGPDGTENGVYVESLKLMGEGSGEAAQVLQTATLKLWQQRMYPAMMSEGGASLAADYAALHAAYGAATDYSSLDLSKVKAGIEAVAAREIDLRHGQGVIVEGDSAIFDLPYYHFASKGIRENERGEYSDAPMVFEYTNNKDLVYKFTAAVDGDFYPEFYFGTQLNTRAHINVLAADSTTKVMPTWSFDPNTGNWQTYTMWNNPSAAKFTAKAGETYFLTMHFDDYVNVRGIYMRMIIQTGKSYEEVQEMQAKAEDAFAKFQEGTAGFFAIGGDLALIQGLEDAIAMASDLAEDSSPEEMTAAYYAMEEAIAKLETAPVINVIPNDDTNIFDFSNGIFNDWRMEGGPNIGYVREGGYVEYTVYSMKDCKYDLAFTCSSPAGGVSQIGMKIDMITEAGDTLHIGDKVIDVQPSGSWSAWDAETANYNVEVAIPVGRILFTAYGETNADNGYIGNINKFHFTEVPGTEGEGTKALEAAVAGIDAVQVAPAADGKIYTIEGIYVGNNVSLLREGFYIMNGKKIVVK